MVVVVGVSNWLFDCYKSAVDKSDNNTDTAFFHTHRELPIFLWHLRDGRRFVPASLESCLGNLTSVTAGSDRNMSVSQTGIVRPSYKEDCIWSPAIRSCFTALFNDRHCIEFFL